MEKRVKLNVHIESLVKFMVDELPDGQSKEYAFIKAQELIWWAQKTFDDEELKKKGEANATETAS